MCLFSLLGIKELREKGAIFKKVLKEHRLIPINTSSRLNYTYHTFAASSNDLAYKSQRGYKLRDSC